MANYRAEDFADIAWNGLYADIGGGVYELDSSHYIRTSAGTSTYVMMDVADDIPPPYAYTSDGGVTPDGTWSPDAGTSPAGTVTLDSGGGGGAPANNGMMQWF